MRIGAHLSISGGYTTALEKIKAIGGNCLQIFSSSPRQWMNDISIYHSQIDEFVSRKNIYNINPIYFHASYLINLADAGRIGDLSKKTLIDELLLAEKMGIKGTIIHLGSFKQALQKDYSILLTNIHEILSRTPASTLFIIENAGNNKICWNLDEMASIVGKLENSRVKVCLDTCHLWGAGYGLSTQRKFDAYFDEFDRKIGLEKLELFQVNDSKDPLGSFRDRHENIGEGTIPIEEFKLLINDQKTKHLPMILEVPGVDKKGPDKKNIDTLKNLIIPS